DAEHRDSLAAELRPSSATVLARAATPVVMVHHPRAVRQLLFTDSGAARDDDAARLVARDHRATRASEPERRAHAAARSRCAIGVQVAAAHAGGLHLDHNFAGSRRRIRKFLQLELALAQKN